MKIKTIKFNGKNYPEFQTIGNAAQFIRPYAEILCEGEGYDIGCGKVEWAIKNAIPIDLTIDDEFDAFNLPNKKVDFIFSSHCLEHLNDWVDALDYWIDTLKSDGLLFLYVPHYSQEYWRPWNNRKHKNIFTPEILTDYLISKNMNNIFSSSFDLNNSFSVICNK
tara:strand:+ start:384 stop:878 length:495 start_codon:yes stop_codon:yes gene_type:complete